MALPRFTQAVRALAPVALSMLLCPALAAAQQPVEEEEPGKGLVVGVRGVGEIWQDSLLIRDMGRSSRFGGTGFVSYNAWRFLSVDLEAGYHRLTGMEFSIGSGAQGTESTTFEMVPIALSVSASQHLGGLEVFGAVGTAFTVFSHADSEVTVSGTKIGPCFHVGARIDTGLVQPSIRRDAVQRIRAVDLELVVGRRQHQPFGVGDGLDLSAWRVGAGLLARF